LTQPLYLLCQICLYHFVRKPPTCSLLITSPKPPHRNPPPPTQSPHFFARPPLPSPRSTASQRDYSSPNALLALRGKAPGRLLEVKALALNRVAPHQLAVGAGDQYVRVYDRRMATPGALGGAQ
jgi:hypothetical protein